MKPDVKDTLERIGKGSAIHAVASAIFPILEEMKQQVFKEFAYVKPEALEYARLAGRAQTIESLLATLTSAIDDGQEAAKDIH